MSAIASVAVGNQPYQFSRDEYLRMSDLGMFRGKRVQLIGGEIIEMAPQNNRHAQGVQALLDTLTAAFGRNYWVRCQMTLDLSPRGMPDPDIAVIPGGWRTHPPGAIPTDAVLVAESSDSTLRDDQTYMMSMYAAAGIRDYWVLNLVDGQLEVYRDPVADPNTAFGSRYATVTIHTVGDAVSPLALPAAIVIADLFP